MNVEIKYMFYMSIVDCQVRPAAYNEYETQEHSNNTIWNPNHME